MKWILLLSLSFLSFACVAKRLPYEADANVSTENSRAIIEQVLAEQPANVAPESSELNNDYIELNFGTQTRVSGRSQGLIIVDGFVIGNTHNTETTKSLKKRIYYNSILECKLYSRGKWFVVQLVDTEQRVMHNFYTRNEAKAKKFGDALLSLKKTAKNPLDAAPKNNSSEKKEVGEKAVETKPAEAKPTESTPAETKPAEAKPAEAKPENQTK